MEKVAEYLKIAREEKKKSVYDVERDIKISHQNLYKWEKGTAEPSIIHCIKLADYYNVTLDYLVGREERDKNVNTKYYKCNINAKDNNNF